MVNGAFTQDLWKDSPASVEQSAEKFPTTGQDRGQDR